MKHLWILAILVLAVGCSAGELPESEPIEVDQDNDGTPEVVADIEEETIEIDADDDGDVDVTVSNNDETIEVEADIQGVVVDGDWCVAGTSYTYESEDGSVDAEVLGLENYKGSEFCKAQATTVIASPVGDMTSETTYYFDNGQSELWVITTTSGGALPAPQTNEIHIVDGDVQ